MTESNSRAAQMEVRLTESFEPVRMSLVNESHNHSVPKNSETHFNLIIVSEAFAGQTPLQRHRAIYAALGDELKNGLHALTMKTLTPEEFDRAGGEVTNPAPLCHSKRK